MRIGLVLGSTLAAVALVGYSLAADDLKSGPQVGARVPGPFNPLHCNGPDDGKKVCLV
jgi:hypothetical protein